MNSEAQPASIYDEVALEYMSQMREKKKKKRISYTQQSSSAPQSVQSMHKMCVHAFINNLLTSFLNSREYNAFLKVDKFFSCDLFSSTRTSQVNRTLF